MIPEHVLTVCAVLAVGYVLVRWGELIFLGYAIYHFWTEQWTYAVLALVYLFFFSFVKAVVMGLSRWTGVYNGKWI